MSRDPDRHNAAQLTGSGYTHDGSGSITGTPSGATLTYNGSEQLVARSGSARGSYTYAGTTQDELISQVGPGGATYTYAWGRMDHNGLPVLGSLATPDGTAYLVHDDVGTPLAIKSYTGTTGFYALDGLGSPIALIKTNGLQQSSYSYDP